MNLLKKYGLRMFYTILAILGSLLVINTFYYFNIINENLYKVFKLILITINILISSFILGKQAENKGYLEGIKLSLLIIPIMIILTLIFNQPFKIKIFIYYLIIFITAVLGSMIGINKKKTD